jgi:hypothetical protein
MSSGLAWPGGATTVWWTIPPSPTMMQPASRAIFSTRSGFTHNATLPRVGFG